MSKQSLALLQMGYIENALAPDTGAWVIYSSFNLFTVNLEAANLSHLHWLSVAKGGKKGTGKENERASQVRRLIGWLAGVPVRELGASRPPWFSVTEAALPLHSSASRFLGK